MEIERVTLEGDTPGQEFFLRVFRFRGSGQGPAVYMQAGLHANEMPGVVALDRLILRLEAAEKDGRLSGSVTLVPQANPIGLAQAVFGETLGRFDVNSRINFNRSFPKDTTESSPGRLASERLKSILLALAVETDVVLDLHCDDEGPVYLYVAEHQIAEGRRLARAVQATVILTEPSYDLGTFDLTALARWAAQNRPDESRFAATIELRGMIDVTPEFAERDADGLYRYLVDLGVVIDRLPEIVAADPVSGDSDAAQLIAVPVPGALLFDAKVGDWVKKGDRLAVVVSDAGTDHHEILSPHNGLVMSRWCQRFIRRGEYVMKVLRHP
jgi:uncharacterized protein